MHSSNNYQGEESETWIGEWVQSRNNRDQLVIATKYTMGFPSGKNGETIKSNYSGNHSKSLRISVEASLKKLQTDYIDIVSLPLLRHYALTAPNDSTSSTSTGGISPPPSRS